MIRWEVLFLVALKEDGEALIIDEGWEPFSSNARGVWLRREVDPEVSEAPPDPRPVTDYERQRALNPGVGTWKLWS